MQPDQTTSERWSWAVQRELDGFQRTVDNKFAELANRVDKSVSTVEYVADKRAVDIQRDNILQHIADIKKDLEDEIRERKHAHEEYVKSRQSQFRWFVSMIIIPVVLGVVQLVMSSK
jgi:hypothetical protein